VSNVIIWDSPLTHDEVKTNFMAGPSNAGPFDSTFLYLKDKSQISSAESDNYYNGQSIFKNLFSSKLTVSASDDESTIVDIHSLSTNLLSKSEQIQTLFNERK